MHQRIPVRHNRALLTQFLQYGPRVNQMSFFGLISWFHRNNPGRTPTGVSLWVLLGEYIVRTGSNFAYEAESYTVKDPIDSASGWESPVPPSLNTQ